MDEELDYVSSSPLVGAKREVIPEDEAKLPTLQRVLRLIDEQLHEYTLISSLGSKDQDLSLETRLEVNRRVSLHLLEIKTLVETTIGNIEEAYNG